MRFARGYRKFVANCVDSVLVLTLKSPFTTIIIIIIIIDAAWAGPIPEGKCSIAITGFAIIGSPTRSGEVASSHVANIMPSVDPNGPMSGKSSYTKIKKTSTKNIPLGVSQSYSQILATLPTKKFLICVIPGQISVSMLFPGQPLPP